MYLDFDKLQLLCLFKKVPWFLLKKSRLATRIGIYIQNDLTWDKQAEHAITKGKNLVSDFQEARRYLNEE